MIFHIAGDKANGPNGALPSDGATMGKLIDLSGRSYQIPQKLAGATFQTNQINSLPVFRFASGQTYAWTSTAQGSIPETNNVPGISAFAVVKVTTATATGTLFNYSIGTSGSTRCLWAMSMGSNSFLGRRLDIDGSDGAGTSTITTGQWYYVSMILDYTNADGFTYTNGVLSGTKTTLWANSGGNTSPTNSLNLSIGGDINGTGQLFVGDIAELQIFNKAMISERTIVETYLKNKYAL